jgi:hypothetical protein
LISFIKRDWDVFFFGSTERSFGLISGFFNLLQAVRDFWGLCFFG